MTTASKANVTYLSLTAPHLFNDAGGLTLLLEGWSSVLKGQANLVPPLFSTLPMESWSLSKPIDEGTPGLWLAEPADLAVTLEASREGAEAYDIFVPRSFLSTLRADAMGALNARGVEDSFLSEGDCLWAWWTKLVLPARKDKHEKLNLGQPIDFRKNIPGFYDGPHRHIRNAVAVHFLSSPFSGDDVDAMPLHELAYTMRQSIRHLREHPEDLQDQAILMSQGRKPYANFDTKLDVGFLSNWLGVGFASPAVDFSPALEGPPASAEAGRIINTRYYSKDCAASIPLTYALCKDGDGDIWMMSQMHKDFWEHPPLQALMV
ncbi:hypothetical protein FIBSPDRAFT_869742 [Athelia psychrophila]|uniref:Uncharacterized protein n=1 Tax=Athelia psychrophila TaxID=1759441 RepID=A0A166BTZ9_9AGAM|nr:hypothetical protein FIBSPDRAFT_869742 [Fibularhizoctonia sp. CBS 109695]